MNNPTSKSLRFIPAALGLVFCLLANHAGATVTTWDPQGTTTTPQSGGFYTGSLSQTWENAKWSTSQTGQATPVNWAENTAALFAVHTGTGTPAFTVTMNANHTVAGIFDGSLTPNPCPVTIAGSGTFILGPANLNGMDPTVDAGNPGSITFNVVVGGVATAGICAENGSGSVYLNETNTYAGGTYLGYTGSSFRSGLWYFNNFASFGTGPIYLMNATATPGTYPGGALVAEGTAAITITNSVINYNYYPTYATALPANLNIAGNTAGVTFSGPWVMWGGGGGTGGGIYASASPLTGGYAPVNLNITNLVIISGTINGTNALTKGGPGTLQLSAANPFCGSWTVNAGTLQVGNPSGLGFGGTTVAFGGVLDLYGATGVETALTLNGTGVNGGGALINSSGTAATLNGDAVSSAVVTSPGSETAPPNILFSGGGGSGAAAVPLLGVTADSFSITPGTQTYSVAPTATITGGYGATATVNLDGNGYVTSVSVTAPGFGFSAAPTIAFTGGTTNTAGTVPTGTGNATSFLVTGVAITAGGSGYTSAPTWSSDSGGASGTTVLSSVNLAADSSFGGAGKSTITALISGSANLTKVGAGAVILAAANTYVGTTTLSNGIVQLAYAENPGVSGPLGASAAANSDSIILNGGTLQYAAANSANDYSGRFGPSTTAYNIDVNGQAVTFATALTSGGATLTLSDTAGGGTLTLSQANSYPGVTTVNSGTLDLTGSIAGNVTVNNTGAVNVSGSGYITGNATVNGGLLDAQVSGALAANVTVNAGALELDNTSAMSSGATLTLVTSPAANTVNLNLAGGTQTISALYFGLYPMAAGTYGAVGSGATYTSAAFTGNGILNVTSSVGSYWDANGSDAAHQDSSYGGGSGNWDNSISSFWWTSGSSDSLWTSDSIASFGGMVGTVTLADYVNADGLVFTTPGYTINNVDGTSVLTLDGAAPEIVVPAGAPTTISCVIASSSPVAVSGPGTLVLSGANTYYAGTTISNGATLSVNAISDSGASAIGPSGTVAMTSTGGNSCHLQYTGSSPAVTAREILANGGNTTSYIDLPAGSLEVDNAFKEAGDSAAQMFTKTGPGTLILGGDLLDNSGLTLAINQGTVIITKESATTAHGLGGGTSIVGTGTAGNSAGLQLVGLGGYDIYHTTALTVKSPDGFFDLNGQSLSALGMGALTLSGAGPTGNGALLNSASGTTSLLYCTGSGLVLAGNATIGGPGSITMVTTVISDGGHGYGITYAGGAGATLTLSNANTFSGGITINPNSTVFLTNSASAGGTGTIAMQANSTLNVGIVPSNASLNNAITSADSTAVINLIETPADNLQLGGVMSGFSGTINCPPTPGTTAKAQILTAAVALPSTATINLAANGTLYLANSVSIPGPVNIYGYGNTETYGALRMESGATVSGPVTLYGNTSMGNGVAGTTGTISGNIGDNSSGYGITFMTRPGTMVLSGASTFSGPVTNLITGAGMLSVNSIADTAPSALGTGSILVISNSWFQYTGSATATTTRNIYSPGATTNILQLTAGSLNVSTIARQSGSGGYLYIVTNGVAGNNTLTLNGTADNSYLGLMIEPGITVVCNKTSGTGHAIGQNSYVNGGTLQLSGNGYGSELFNQINVYVNSGVFDANGQNNTFYGLLLSGTGLNNGGALINSAAGTTSTLTCAVGLAANASIGGPGNITLPSAVTNAYSLTYVGTGILTLGGVNTYSSATAVNSGALVVNGSTVAASTVTVAPGATVGGSGTINGSLTLQSGQTPSAILAPGVAAASAGTTLTLPGSVTLGGGCIVSNRISKTAGPTFKADKVNKSSGTLTLLGAALTVTLDTGGIPLASGDTFTLFSGTLAGSFSSFSLPTLPTGLQWNTSQLTAGGNGTLTVACSGTLGVSASGAATICSGGSATLTATPSGGSGTYSSYLWSPGGATGASPSVSPATTTTYTVTVTDSGGCTATSSGVTVTVNNCTPTLTSTTISNIIGTTLTYGGGSGSHFVLLSTNNVSAPMTNWTRLATNSSTPGSFTIPAAGSSSPVFYRIQSQ